jgi:hypothetical protein
MTIRHYSNIAGTLQTTSPVSSSQTAIPVPTTSGYPTPPFLLGLNRGLSDEEVCLCTGTAPTSFTVVRGYDNTTAVAHNPCVVEHTSAAIEFREANAFINLMNVNGDLLYQSGTGSARLPIGNAGQLLGVVNGFPQWTNPIVRDGRHYAVSGLLAVANQATNYLPPFNFSLPSGQTAVLSKLRGHIRAGTNVVMHITQNGSNVIFPSGSTTITLTPTGTTFTPTTPPAVADEDAFAPVITTTSGNPDGLSLTFYFDVAI